MIDPLDLLAGACVLFAAPPTYFYFRNQSVFTRPTGAAAGAVSVLIPARNEADNIEECIQSVLSASEEVEVEVIALDDASDDDTASIVERLAADDSRVRLLSGQPLPDGWNGKQHACQQLADAAGNELILWIDADVRLEPLCLTRLLAERERTRADLLSGFPRQITRTPLESMLLPLIHFVLLGFLSLRAMRESPNPGFAAGCGQLFLTDKASYQTAGGHAAIRSSRHDGVTLPRAYRRAGKRTDLCDATDLARCRMYHGALAVWRGLLKNATEGVATPALIAPVTAVLLLGQVVWAPLLSGLLVACGPLYGKIALLAGLISLAPRLHAVIRFRQSPLALLLHPLNTLLFLIIQWEALVRAWLNKPIAWRGRV